MAEERNFLLVRKRGVLFTPACLYERTDAEGKSQVRTFARIGAEDAEGKSVSEGRAMAYRITLESGVQVDVLVSFDGRAHSVGDLRTDAKTRIAVSPQHQATD